MIRDIHGAVAVDLPNSTFGGTVGELTLLSGATTTRFYLSNNKLMIDVNGSTVGPLSASDASVTALTFTHITTAESEAVKIDMTIDGTKGSVTKTKTYHSTDILKKS